MIIRLLVTGLIGGLASAAPPPASTAALPLGPVDAGYRAMYNLDFDQAHKIFTEWEQLHPGDPLGPASNAAAYLFAEFDRLRILQSEFFVEDSLFKHRAKVTPDPAAYRAFDQELSKAEQLADSLLSQSPQQTDAMFAKTLALGLRADYLALVEKRYLESLSAVKSSRALAEKLLSLEPSYYDAYLAIGVENYLLSLKAAPLRWFLQMNGAQTDKGRGIQNLRLTAEKGHYLSPYARLLLAVAALRDKDRSQAREILSDLSREFPHNRLYVEELARLQ
jgi:hypothetical protein